VQPRSRVEYFGCASFLLVLISIKPPVRRTDILFRHWRLGRGSAPAWFTSAKLRLQLQLWLRPLSTAPDLSFLNCAWPAFLGVFPFAAGVDTFKNLRRRIYKPDRESAG